MRRAGGGGRNGALVLGEYLQLPPPTSHLPPPKETATIETALTHPRQLLPSPPSTPPVPAPAALQPSTAWRPSSARDSRAGCSWRQTWCRSTILSSRCVAGEWREGVWCGVGGNGWGVGGCAPCPHAYTVPNAEGAYTSEKNQTKNESHCPNRQPCHLPRISTIAAACYLWFHVASCESMWLHVNPRGSM